MTDKMKNDHIITTITGEKYMMLYDYLVPFVREFNKYGQDIYRLDVVDKMAVPLDHPVDPYPGDEYVKRMLGIDPDETYFPMIDNGMNQTVYACSIHKCSNKSCPPCFETSIEAPKRDRGQQNSLNPDTSKPDSPVSPYGHLNQFQQKRQKPLSITKKAMNDINQWTMEQNPTHFLSIQFPHHMRSDKLWQSKKCLQNAMSKFEYRLLKRHWHKKHLTFIAFAEKGKGVTWHFHLLLNARDFTTERLYDTLDKILLDYTFQLDPIWADDVHSYCTKELRVRLTGEFDSDRIIPSHELFNLPVKDVSGTP